MPRWCVIAVLSLVTAAPAHAAPATWPAPRSPAVPNASGYVAIPGAALRPHAGQVYRAVFDATRAAETPTALLPAIDMAGSELNAVAVEKLPLTTARFALVFHGPAVDGLLKDDLYRARHHCANPNLEPLKQMKKAGVELFVCGQHLAAAGIDPATLSPDITVASDALLVLMDYQARGYALMSF